MNTTLLLQSDIQDPYLIYKKMLHKKPVHWDDENKIWVIYSYQHCVEILKNTDAFIPIINPNNEQELNNHASNILNNLVRLSNGIQHTINREIANLLFSNMKAVQINKTVSQLIQNDLIENKIDWVDSVCKKIPVLVVLKSFGFAPNDCACILERIESLSKIMFLDKTEDQVKLINEIAEVIFSIVEKQLLLLDFYKPLLNKTLKSAILSPSEIKTITISNLIGLLIQSYDAGRGILSNSLLQIIDYKTFSNKTTIEKSIIETLRFDPPIHNSRRIANTDIVLGETKIRKGDKILVVLASANRDLEKFENECNFDIERFNNKEHLTFGIGAHQCLAKHFSIYLATEVLYFLFDHYKTITLLENNIQYEPMVNARLPKNIWISL